jgi:fucose permease
MTAKMRVGAPKRRRSGGKQVQLIEPRFRGLFLYVFALFALFGTSMTIIGATLPKILASFDWSYLTAGIVIGAGAVAYFVSTFVAGDLVKRWGSKPTILLALALIVAGLAFFATTPDPAANTLLSGLIGLGQGGVEVGLNSTILRMDERNTGRPMNVLHGAFAVGAIVGPFAVGLLLQSGLDWAVVYRGMAVIFVALAAMTGLAALPPVQAKAADPGERRERLSAHPAYWLSFFALFLYLGVELGVSNWVAEYFVVVFAYSPEASAMLVSLFWLGVLVGRFGVPLLYKGARPDAALIGLSALATASIALLLLLGYAPAFALAADVGRGLLFLAGLGCSIYYPTVMTLVGGCFPRAQSQAVGFAATGGGIGSFVFPFLMSSIAQNWGIRAGFATYGVFAAGMTLVAAWLAVVANRGKNVRRLSTASLP